MISDAIFAVQRNDRVFSCKGSELKDKLQDGDILFISRDGVTHQFLLEDQGALQIIVEVDFEFNDAGAIVITQNAEAKGGDTPYVRTTEYDMELGTDVLDKNLARFPISAVAVNGTPYMSFGVTTSGPSYSSQEVYSLNIEKARYDEEFLNSGETNNRYGLKSSTFQGNKIAIVVYNRNGSGDHPSTQTNQFIYVGLDETLITNPKSSADYAHLHAPASYLSGACTGFVTDKNGNYYSGWYGEGLFKHTNVSADSFGYPDFTSTSITTVSKYQSSDFFKGLSYHKESNSIFWSSFSKCMKYDIDADSVVLLSGDLESDGNKSVIHSFTSNFVIRTVINEAGTIDRVRAGAIAAPGTWTTPIGDLHQLYINDPDNKYLFKLIGGETVKMLSYSYTGNPFDPGAPWQEFREEPLPSGNIGGAGTITLDPFTLMWFQSNELKSWGVIPAQNAKATVIQTITDANGDSVSSEKEKYPS